MKNLLIELGKIDFLKRVRHGIETIKDIDISYSEEFDTGCKEGYTMRVVDNHVRIFFIFECEATITFEDGEKETFSFDSHEMFIPIGYKTPKGYFSRKKVDVNFEYRNGESLTIDQVSELLKFTTDAKANTFDPFYHKNQAKSRNAAGWNYVAANYITDPYCTR